MTETTETPALVEVTQADRKLLNEIERFAFVAGQEALISDDALDVIARHRLAAERTPSTVAPDAGLVGWRYEINYGPEGETNYANVYDGRGEFVGNLKVHHAIALTAPAPADAAEREAERGWQPIESAPWDGTPILGYHPDYGQRETLMEHYRDGTIGFAQHGPAEIGWRWIEEKHCSVHRWKPSHWMPLSPPPALNPPTTEQEKSA